MNATNCPPFALDLESALLLVLDQVDYLAGNCQVHETVGAVLPKEVIRIARRALQEHRKEGMAGKREE